MGMTTRAFALALGLGIFLVVGTAHAATDLAGKCKDAKAKAAGKKASALLKAVGKNFKKSSLAKLASDVSKAQSKLTKSFVKAESKGGCLTVGDVSAIEGKIDAFVDDATGTVVSGPSNAEQIADVADCVEGPLSRCRLGDYLLENDVIRVVVQDVQRNSFGMSQFGGQIIDADLNRGGGQEIDNFEEWAVNVNIENTVRYTDLTIINDGSDGNAAVIRATGPDDLLDFINASSVVASFGFPFPAAADDNDLAIEASTDYILPRGKNYVRVETTLQNTDSSELDIFFGSYLNGSGQVELFQAGYGFGETLVSSACDDDNVANPCNVIIYHGVDNAAGVTYGIVHDVPGSTAFTASGVTVPLLGVEITTVLVGVTPPNFTLAPMGDPGDSITITQYFVIGDDVDSILRTRNGLQGIVTGQVAGTVETTSGGPAAGVEVAVLGDAAEGPVGLGPIDLNVVNHTRTDANGAFSMALPPGTYDVVVNLEGSPYQGGGSSPALNAAVITAFGNTDLGTITVPDTGALQVNVADGSSNALPAKASVVGFDPSPPVPNTQSLLGLINNSTNVFRDRDEDGLPFGIAQVLFIDPSGASDTIPLEPGSYEVTVSRGLEYSIDSDPITVTALNTETVNAEIAPVLDTTGYISGDFHVHSIESADSEVTQIERIVSMLAEGQEFFTPSDHGIRTDGFQPIIDTNGWSSLVTTAGNAEITTFDYGHFNAWPVTVDPGGGVNGGNVDWGGAAPAGMDFPSFGNYSLTPEEIVAAAKTDPGAETVQINHIASHFGIAGSGDLGSGLAIDTGLEPPMSVVPPSARRLDPTKEDAMKGYFTDTFDALEVWIGAGNRGAQADFLDQNAGDWFNMLNQGIVRTGIADSDTHQRIITQAGFPRTMIAETETDLTLLDPETLSATVNNGRAIGTNGPMIRVSVEALTSNDTASLEAGDTNLVTALDGEVEVTVTIQSPVWAEFDTVEYYLNSTTIQSITEDVQTGAGLVDVARYGIAPDFTDTPTVSTVLVDGSVPGGSRLEATSTLTLTGGATLTEDTWIVVMVKGTDGVSEPLFPVIPNAIDESANTTLGDLTDGNLGEDGVLALAFSNPLFVDFDGNASYDPPGVSFIPAPSPSSAFLDSIDGLLD
jgi:hypothetical protein